MCEIVGDRYPAQPGVDCGNCRNGAFCIDDAACDILERRTMMKNETTMESSVTVIVSCDGKFSAQWRGPGTPVICNCLMVGAERAGDPLRVSCCHPDVLAREAPAQMQHLPFADGHGGIQVCSDGDVTCDGLMRGGERGEDVRCLLRGQTQESTETWENVVAELLAHFGMDPQHQTVSTPACARQFLFEAIRAIRESVPVVEVIGRSGEADEIGGED